MEKATSRWLVAFLFARGGYPYRDKKTTGGKESLRWLLGMAKNHDQPHLTLVRQLMS